MNDLSGRGSFLYGGRWNSEGLHAVYTSEQVSLSLLENIVHFSHDYIPKVSYGLLTISIPDQLITSLQKFDQKGEWRKKYSSLDFQKIGDAFLKDGIYTGLRVPSVIVPQEYNVILNPRHILYDQVKITSQEEFIIDSRLF
jgi:RES domain-containing protein